MLEKFKAYYYLAAIFVAIILISCTDGYASKPSKEKIPTNKPELVTEIDKQGLTCPDISDLAKIFIAKHSDEVWGKEFCRFRSVARDPAIEVVLFTLEGQCWNKKGQG